MPATEEKKLILIAEDEKAMAHALEVKLTKAGFEVELAVDGESALEQVKKKKYDLILLDIMMPRKNGFEVLEEFKKIGVKVPVIVTSNLGQSEDLTRAKSLGAKDYLIKSDTPIGKILEKITELLK